MVLITTSEAFYVRLVEEARRHGIGLSEFICAELARHHQLDVPDYIQPTQALDIALPTPLPITPKEKATVRVPEDHHSRYQAEADRRGMPLAVYARQTMAGILGLEPFPADIEVPEVAALLSA